MDWRVQIKEKRVLFITTKNLDYLRNVQELSLLRSAAKEVVVIGSANKSYAKRMLTVYWSLLKTNCKRYDCVFCGFAPQLVYPLLWLKKPRFLVMDFFISCYDTLAFDRKKVRPNGAIGKALKWLDAKTLALADVVIGDTKAHCDYFSAEFSCPRERFHVLYLQADTSIYYPRPMQPKQSKRPNTVLYFGSILPLQGVDVILQAIPMLPDVHFVMVGPLDETSAVAYDNAEYIPWLSQEALAEKIAQADLCLAGHFHATIEKAKRTIPGKAYIYEAMQKPMILGDNPANRERYNPSMDGIYFVEMGSAQALADGIALYFKNEKNEKNEKNKKNEVG